MIKTYGKMCFTHPDFTTRTLEIRKLICPGFRIWICKTQYLLIYSLGCTGSLCGLECIETYINYCVWFMIIHKPPYPVKMKSNIVVVYYKWETNLFMINDNIIFYD